MSFPAVNKQNGAYYIAQDQSTRGLDPFAVLGLHADSPGLTQAQVRLHVKAAVKHVYERKGMVAEGVEHVSIPACGATFGPRVPTWVHVNKAKELLLAGNEPDFQRLRAEWVRKGSRQTWNPLAELLSRKTPSRNRSA